MSQQCEPISNSDPEILIKNLHSAFFPVLMNLATVFTTLVVSLLLSSINAEESKSSSNNNNTSTILNDDKTTNRTNNESDTREKRNLNGFGTNFYYNNNNNKKNFYSNVPKAASTQQTAQRRSSSGSAGGYQFNSFNQHSANYYGHGPQYLEAPEPIIEIIIKDSNDTYPIAAPLIASPKKKKKEEVQVYYVKYKHDEHHGLQVDVPVPAIAPAINDDHNSHEDHAQADEVQIVTLPPPRKTTTIRAIIHPESEKFHAHGNVRISFGAPPSSVSQHRQENARQISEYTNEESALQPVVAHPNSPNSVRNDEGVFTKHDQYFDIQGRVVNNFNHVNQVQPPQKPAVNFNVNQVLPPQKPAQNFHAQQSHGQQFQHSQFSQGLARPQFSGQQTTIQQFNPPPPTQQHNTQHLHFHHNQRPQNFQSNQHQQQQFFNVNSQRGQFPPQHLQIPTKQAVRFNSHTGSKFQFGQQQQQQQQHFHTNQPRPIPIPLHQVQQQPNSNQFSNVKFNQPFTAFQQQQPPPSPPRQETARPTEQRPFAPTRIQGTHFQYEQIVQNNQQQRPAEPQTTSVHQGLVQQQAPQNLAQQNPKLREHLEHIKYVLPPGGEVVASIPQYEQHITETIQNTRPQFQQQQQQQHQQQQQQQHHQQHAQQQQHHQQQLQTQQSQQVQQIQQQSLHHHQQQQSHGQHNFRQEVTAPPLIHKQVTSSSNIGPLAHTIGHLHVGERLPQPTTPRTVNDFERYSSQQQLQSFRGPQQFNSDNSQFNHHHFQNQQAQQQNLIQQSHQQFKMPQESNPQRNTFSVPFNHHAVEPLRDPSEPPLSSFLHQQEPRHPDSFPNALPLLQRPKPGQSVSTRYSDLFPSEPQLPKNHQSQQYHQHQMQQQQQQQQQQKYQSNQQFSQGHFIREEKTTTTERPSTTEAPKPETTTKDYSVVLPDEVPDDLREQLLSSGILANADISVLDYDKIGDTSLQDLPPEHLANFFSAGGKAQLAGSETYETVVKPDGEKVAVQYAQTVKKHPTYKNAEKNTLPKKEKVDLKVVRFDSNAPTKQSIPEKYIDTDSTVLPTVDLNDQVYNRYLPLKINGAQFPIPDVAELKGRRISSVVVLAPVDNPDQAEDRSERSDSIDSKQIKFIAGDALKQLVKKPSTDNFRRWLDREGKTDVDLQSVVLLVTKTEDNDQEIFMYDIPTKAVNKLSGELSSAFVSVAEENATTHDIDGASILDSGIIEQVKPGSESDQSSQENKDEEDEEITTIQSQTTHSHNDSVEYDTDMDMGDDASAEGSENIETVVKFDVPVETVKETPAKPEENKVLISSGYSVIKS
uniref:CSON008465 protein n=1 Tax=Culicoides sonorensis TaxID=179676 RepID=A0A336LJT7_CULSO